LPHEAASAAGYGAAFGRPELNMQVHTTPKLYPPMALLWTGPMPYQCLTTAPSTVRADCSLSRDELRSIVSEMVD
jgi:hypothetical protein